MLIIILTIATLLMAAWLVLFGRVDCNDLTAAVYARLFDDRKAIDKLVAKEKANREKLAHFTGISQKFIKLLLARENIQKKISKLEQEIEQLRSGNTRAINPLVMPGYVLQREIESIGKSGFRKTILSKSFELYGKKHAGYKTAELVAKMLSYPIIGISFSLTLGVVLLAADIRAAGMGVVAIGTVLVMVLVYGIYDEMSDSLKKRRKAISRQFPNVISKLALLVTSGMIMDRAWKETAYSQETELYLEMRKTSEELDNLVSPEAAYSNFINRCNTKETAKLASAIMQNQSKGNAEIGRLLKDMAREVWQERRHTAKRDAEKANSKLMIPTMLLFLAILVMLMVPIAMNFSGI